MGTDTAWPAKFTFDEFWSFTEPLEGGFAADCMFMVQDLQVATGMGITFTGKSNRNAGLQMAKALDWVYKPGHAQAGGRCSPSDLERDYDLVLSNEELGQRGPGFLAQWKAMTNCRITKEGLKGGVRSRVIGNINYVKRQRTGNKSIGDFDTLPADAQLCVISLTWANGNEFNYPDFCRACREANWFEAAKECGFKSKENTLPKRQKAQEEMMRNAACVTLGAASGDTLQWPNILQAGPYLSWLVGWWTVWDGNNYYYFFDDTGSVVYIETKPTTSAAPASPKNRGTYFFNRTGQLVVKWHALAGLGPAIETFYNASRGAPQMNANSNLYSPLVATKIR
jgi:hypothetical protein